MSSDEFMSSFQTVASRPVVPLPPPVMWSSADVCRPAVAISGASGKEDQRAEADGAECGEQQRATEHS